MERTRLLRSRLIENCAEATPEIPDELRAERRDITIWCPHAGELVSIRLHTATKEDDGSANMCASLKCRNNMFRIAMEKAQRERRNGTG